MRIRKWFASKKIGEIELNLGFLKAKIIDKEKNREELDREGAYVESRHEYSEEDEFNDEEGE